MVRGCSICSAGIKARHSVVYSSRVSFRVEYTVLSTSNGRRRLISGWMSRLFCVMTHNRFLFFMNEL